MGPSLTPLRRHKLPASLRLVVSLGDDWGRCTVGVFSCHKWLSCFFGGGMVGWGYWLKFRNVIIVWSTCAVYCMSLHSWVLFTKNLQTSVSSVSTSFDGPGGRAPSSPGVTNVRWNLRVPGCLAQTRHTRQNCTPQNGSLQIRKNSLLFLLGCTGCCSKES